MKIGVTRTSQKQQTATVIGVYFRGQFSAGEPDHFLSLDTCKEMKRRGLGEFINRGRAFRRFDTSQAMPFPKPDNTCGNYGVCSLIIEEMTMMRFVAGDPVAVTAVNAWA